MERVSKPILVITDHVGNEIDGFTLTAPSLQLLTLARQLTTGRIDAIALNPQPQLDVLSQYGVSRVLVPDLSKLSPRVAGIVADCAWQAAQRDEYAAILNVSNYRGREVAAILATRLRCGAAVDVTNCQVIDGCIKAQKNILAGSWTTHFSITRGTPVISLRPSSITAEAAAQPGEVEMVSLPVEFSPASLAVTVEESREQAQPGRVSLTEAEVVVCVGRGIDGDLTLAEEFADQLGAAVGATRVVCDEGWVDRSLQIGQTGVSVAAKLYIGLGVSGAVHHACGIGACEHIVAVCDDPDAPIMQFADFAIVGDINEVVPAALAELRKDS